MPLAINRAIFSAMAIRSDALGPLDSIAHPLAPGVYDGEVWKGDTFIGRFRIEAAEGGDGEQVDIDLCRIAASQDKQAAAFQLGLYEKQPAFAVFHCGGGASGFHVLLRGAARKVIYDTRKMQPGDYYIVTPIKPGKYAVALAGRSRGKSATLTVEQAKPDGKARTSERGAMIIVKAGFEPAEAKIVSGDGVVFEIAGPDTAISLTPARDASDKPEPFPRKLNVRYWGRGDLKR